MNEKKTSLRAGMLLLACCWAGLAVAGPVHWQWRDAQGKVVFSDRPPPGTVAEKDILVRPGGAAPSIRPQAVAPVAAQDPAASQALKPVVGAEDPALAAKKKELEAAADAKRKAEEARQAQARTENCQRAKGYEKTLNDGGRIMHTNAKGEREVLDDAGRAAELARARSVIGQDCKP
jgi:Domain of unknown function (DUF4124)